MLRQIIDAYLSRTRPTDETVWHKCEPLFPVRLTNGEWSEAYGQLWRRKVGDRWEYQQDPETREEYLDRGW